MESRALSRRAPRRARPLPAATGAFARGNLHLDAESAALPLLRRTWGVVRCGGRHGELEIPGGLAGAGPEIILVPVVHAGRFHAVLAVVPSRQTPLLSRQARGFLVAYADTVALVLDKLSESGNVDRLVARRTAELADLVAQLEKPTPSTDSGSATLASPVSH